MIEFSTPDRWTSDDTIALRTFLATEAGKKLIPALSTVRASLLTAGETNAILIASGIVIGCDRTISELLRLSIEFPEDIRIASVNSALPPLEDDSAFNDGHTLNPTN